VHLSADGGAVVESNVHDIGTGVQTVLSQIAAEELGIPLDRVEMRWGDTDLPRTGPTYGSSTTMGTGSAVAAAARDVTKQLADLGLDAGQMTDAGVDELVGEGAYELPGRATFNGDGEGTPYAMRTWGAVFVEVGVDPDFGVLRLRRAVGVYSAGRIVNALTARAQMIGAIVWGWGKATMEESDQEPVYGRWLAKNLSNVAVPVNADIQNGDLLVTSGIDGTYPSGLPVAVVSNVERNAAYAFARITCTPAAGVNSAAQVMIVAASEQLPENPATDAPTRTKSRKAKR
jgi:xanthine dehydrogenase YagR molybdenum-binding subunit